MGLRDLSKRNVPQNAASACRLQRDKARVIALAGNPNVGKSTVFNALTGMKQHTGNWTGKTVACAEGHCVSRSAEYRLVDIPGTYSLLAHSAEEEVARNFICFGDPDAVVIVCDATCLERNLNLALQILEITPHAVVCVNLLDEASRKGIEIDLKELEGRLGVPVVGTVARRKKTLSELLSALDRVTQESYADNRHRITYSDSVEAAIAHVEAVLKHKSLGRLDLRHLSVCLLDCDASMNEEINRYLGFDPTKDAEVARAIAEAWELLRSNGISPTALRDELTSATVTHAETICRGTVHQKSDLPHAFDRRLDRILTGRITAIPIMLLLLLGIFWLTIYGANYPSQWLSVGLSSLGEGVRWLLTALGAPLWLTGLLVDGVLGVLFRVISVMLPPMAIFFPLFTVLEDAGYLPRIAYNLDRPFARCNACGKQSLCMCMGFGCNAVGVVGCRIIDSPRERMLAILTNSFVPCNGRFPTLIAILTMFFVGFSGTLGSSVLSALLLTLVILLGIAMTFAVTKLLSVTLLRGLPSSFVLEMPPYRPPEVGRILVRSIFDRTLFVLGRSVAVAAPVGLVIWILANVSIGELSLLAHLAAFLDPVARCFGLDGVILLAFLLGLPANEIVIPIIIMAYTAQGSLIDAVSPMAIKELFVANGWTPITALCVLLFMLFHWPCSTTLITVYKETKSRKWTLLAALLPTVVGLFLCGLVNLLANTIG